uniref:Uncharacterized protein n=1 Tax=Oryza rufipogon TaxID=4529 RepID=A0A0E0QVV1_ORYRU
MPSLNHQYIHAWRARARFPALAARCAWAVPPTSRRLTRPRLASRRVAPAVSPAVAERWSPAA